MLIYIGTQRDGRDPFTHLSKLERECIGIKHKLHPQAQWIPKRYSCDLLLIERQWGCTELADNVRLILLPKSVLGEILEHHDIYLAEGNLVGQQPLAHLLLLRSARQGECSVSLWMHRNAEEAGVLT